jgi:hypothetical protein
MVAGQRWSAPAGAIWLLAFGAACGSAARDEPPPGEPGALVAAIQDAHRRMHVRFTAAQRIEQAIAHSDLTRAHGEAHELARVDEPEALPAWRPYFDSIRDAARQIELAGNVIGAAQLTAGLGRRCARCHEAIRAHIVFPAEPPPPVDPHARLVTDMLGHQWAAVQLWQGLIGPDEDRWAAGAQQLTTAPLDIVAQSVTPRAPIEVDDVARLRMYATRALHTGPQDARAELFGTMLATCAHCHALLRDR